MIVKQLLEDMADKLGDGTTKGRVRHLRWLNTALNIIRYDVDWPQLRRHATLTIAQDVYEAVLPGNVMLLAPDNQMIIPTEEERITRIAPLHLKLGQPGLEEDTNRDRPAVFADWEWMGVMEQPAAATTLEISSDGTESNLLVNVQGTVDGEEDREQVTLNGATPSVTTTKSFSNITAISKAAVSVGKITVTDGGSPATTFATLGRLNYTKAYIKIRLYPRADEAYNANYDFIPWAPELYYDGDVPTFPEAHHQMLLDRALMFGYEYKSPKHFVLAERNYNAGLEKARNETGRDQGAVKSWQWGGDFSPRPWTTWNRDAFIRSLYWG